MQLVNSLHDWSSAASASPHALFCSCFPFVLSRYFICFLPFSYIVLLHLQSLRNFKLSGFKKIITNAMCSSEPF